jgi:Ca2+-binding RTX toxin-like protein
MAIFTAADIPLDMRGIDVTEEIHENDTLFLDETTFSAAGDDGFTNTYTGMGFVDNDADNIPDSGIIESLSLTFEGDPVVLMSGFSLAWEDYWTFVALGDTEAYLDALFHGNDTFTGSSGKDYLFALGGNDTISGLGGNDALYGGKGKDDIDGGRGRDKITGGAGHDTMTGGKGADTFVFLKVSDSRASGTPDVIADYNGSEGDRIDLRKIDADSTLAGNQAFHLGGTSFDGEAGELIIVDDGVGNASIQADIDGDAVADCFFDAVYDNLADYHFML